MQINSQHMFEISAFNTYACFEWCPQCVNGMDASIARCSMRCPPQRLSHDIVSYCLGLSQRALKSKRRQQHSEK